MFWSKKRDCLVDGHRVVVKRRKGITNDYEEVKKHFRAVAVHVEQRRETCRDCDIDSGWITDGYGRGINSLSMPPQHWDQLERDGFLPR